MHIVNAIQSTVPTITAIGSGISSEAQVPSRQQPPMEVGAAVKVELQAGQKKLSQPYSEDGLTLLAEKVARGESLGVQEKSFLAKEDLELLRKADKANMKRLELGARIRQAKTVQEAEKLLLSAKAYATALTQNDKVDPQYACLLTVAYQKVEQDFQWGSIREDDAYLCQRKSAQNLHEQGKGRFVNWQG